MGIVVARGAQTERDPATQLWRNVGTVASAVTVVGGIARILQGFYYDRPEWIEQGGTIIGIGSGIFKVSR